MFARAASIRRENLSTSDHFRERDGVLDHLLANGAV